MPGMSDPFGVPPGGRRPPVVLDMTPEGEFRTPPETAPRPWLDRALGRVGGLAMLVALGAGGLLLAGLAVLAIGVLLPVVLVAGLVAFGTLYWKLRRAGLRPGAVRFTVMRR